MCSLKVVSVLLSGSLNLASCVASRTSDKQGYRQMYHARPEGPRTSSKTHTDPRASVEYRIESVTRHNVQQAWGMVWCSYDHPGQRLAKDQKPPKPSPTEAQEQKAGQRGWGCFVVLQGQRKGQRQGSVKPTAYNFSQVNSAGTVTINDRGEL